MTNSIQPKQTDIELWQDVLGQSIELTEKELGYSIHLERLMIEPSLLPESEQQAIELYEFTLYSYAKTEWQDNEDRCRRIKAKILEREQERKRLWLKAKNHQDIVENWKEERKTRKGNSTDRAMDALYGTYYHHIVDAGVSPDKVSELASRQDKFVVNAERAVARTVKNDDLTQQEKDAKIREIVDDATEPGHTAADIRRKYLNGNVKMPRDIFWLKDGTRLVTFICDSDEKFLELDKHTGDMVDIYGNTEQILLSTKDERIKQSVLEQFTIALAIIQSGETERLSLADKQVIEILKEYGIC